MECWAISQAARQPSRPTSEMVGQPCCEMSSFSRCAFSRCTCCISSEYPSYSRPSRINHERVSTSRCFISYQFIQQVLVHEPRSM